MRWVTSETVSINASASSIYSESVNSCVCFSLAELPADLHSSWRLSWNATEKKDNETGTLPTSPA